jgi:drug/metabolite transporter (DMT)-like permease
MLYLIVTILSGVAVAAILRYNESLRGDRYVVAGTNYVVAGALSILLRPVGAFAGVSAGELAFGVAVGLGFVGGFVAIMHAMKEIGMAVPATASRLSTLVPVVGSVLLYREIPSTLQYAGIAVGILAFVMLGIAQRRRSDGQGISAVGLWLLLAVFVISGSVDLAMKIAHESGSAEGPFLTIVFATACAVCAGAVLFGRRSIRPRDLLVGAALGVPNFTASYFLLEALERLDGVVVFPTMNASIVLGVTLLAILIWRELPTPATATGLALAAAAVVLLGLG